MTRDADNDNEPLTFHTLAAPTARVIERLMHEQKNEDAGSNGDSASTAKKDSDAHQRYVDQRLRELAAFEERADGKKRTGRSGQG